MAMSSEELDKINRRNLKVEAFKNGRAGMPAEQHDAWMDDKWTLHHSVKIEAAYHDGVHCTKCLDNYAGACVRLRALDLAGYAPQKSGIDGDAWALLNKAVKAVGVPLPGKLKMDFDPTTLLPLVPNKANLPDLGNDKEFAKARRKASYELLEACTTLINLVMDWVDTAKQQKSNQQKLTKEIAIVRGLVGVGFFDSLNGYLHGHCHLKIFEALSQKMTQLPH